MAMPPHLTTPGPEVLRENAFVFEGYTLDFAAFAVHDLTADSPCEVEVQLETEEEVAERWRDHPDPPCGAVQWKSRARVTFTPAVPGHRYRLSGAMDDAEAEYRGPAVP